MSISNKFICIGRFTKDPELKTVGTGEKATSVCNFSLAINRRFSPKDHPEADFLDFVAWGSKAENIVKFFTKGTKIGIEGRVETHTYEDKEGNKRKAWEIQVEDFDFVEGKKENSENSGNDTSENTQSENNTPNEADNGDGDLPF